MKREDSPADGLKRRGSAARYIPRFGLLAATIFLLLAAGEIAVRTLTEIGPQLAVRDPVLGKRYIQSYEDRVFVPEADGVVGLRFNRDGFRGPDRPYEKPHGVRRVAVIGDSMTVLVATEEERTWVSRLGHLLEAGDPGDRLEILNFGVSSASTGQELVIYREVASRYDPDLVILAFFVGNDVTDNSRRLTRAPRIYFDMTEDGGIEQLPYSASTSMASAWLNQHSRLYVWYRTVSTLSKARIRLAKNELEKRHLVFRTDTPGDLEHAWQLTERLITTFAAEVEANGSRFALVVLPTGPQIHEDLWEEILTAAGDDALHFDPTYPERRFGDLCAAHDLECAIVLDGLRAEAATTEDRLFYDNGRRHFNDEGNRLAADLVFEGLSSSSSASPELVDPDDGP